ncbi:glutathione S-transferase N-terminal domain-containing protein [Polycladidibacter stylochi]|uniref:glutathione S-transferase N-terminal domain-containing protein n=1 Tax=Polycladidibacter stylochi TaxID=1807766 RepID=UPI00083242DD|nr:glutathione S-transferase N-terminal domain-containing protein [Pseudovibrio stylochi]
MPHQQIKPIELYYWPTPNGHKISILLEELGVPYELKMINIGQGDQFEPDFLKIAPNNRMPAIIDPEGPDGKPISVFESGAIMQYLGRKFGQFYPQAERARVEVEEWLMWQMGGFGPMLGQNHHFRIYAPEKIEYAMTRYLNETHRLYGVLDRRLDGRDYVAAGEYTIADMAILGWSRGWEAQGMAAGEFKNVEAWRERLEGRPAVQRGLEAGKEEREKLKLAEDKQAQSVLFNQRAR